MSLSIVTAFAVFLMLATNVHSADTDNQYCGGVPPVPKNFSTCVGKCYMQRMRYPDTSSSSNKCKALTIVTDTNNNSKGQLIDNEHDQGQKIFLPFFWVQNGSNIAQVIITTPIIDLTYIGTMIYDKDGDKVLVVCSTTEKTDLNPYAVILCTKHRNPGEAHVTAIMDKIQGMGLNNTNMHSVNQDGCKH